MEKSKCAELSKRVIQVAEAAFGKHIRGAILKGSAYKGDFILGYSDFDVHCFISGEAMRGPRVPRVDYALAFQEHFGTIRPEDYDVSACQIYFLSWDEWPSDWLKPLPGSYQLIYGALPPGFTDVNPQDYLRGAHEHYLAQLSRVIDDLIGGFVDKPDGSLARYARLLGTYVKPVTYNMATLLTQDPLGVWQRPWAEVIALAEREACPSGQLSVFYREVRQWKTVRQDPARLRQLIKIGIEALDEVYRWYRSRYPA